MISAENSKLLPLADQRVKEENKFGDRMIKRLLNTAIEKYRYLSMSFKSIIYK